jgi:hypothetical protein
MMQPFNLTNGAPSSFDNEMSPASQQRGKSVSLNSQLPHSVETSNSIYIVY